MTDKYVRKGQSAIRSMTYRRIPRVRCHHSLEEFVAFVLGFLVFLMARIALVHDLRTLSVRLLILVFAHRDGSLSVQRSKAVESYLVTK